MLSENTSYQLKQSERLIQSVGETDGVTPVVSLLFSGKRYCRGILLLFLLFVAVGCSPSVSSSRAVSPGAGQWTPVDHARSQLKWIRGSSGSLSEEELFHAMNTPWSGSRLSASQRKQWIRKQMLKDSGTETPASFSGGRVLDRPSAMSAAANRWQEELKESRSD